MDDFDKFYLKAVNYLSYRPRSEKEVRSKLAEKKAPQDIIEKVISTLKEQRFINDKQFAEEWVRSRSTYRLKSKRIIKYELIKKGIDPETIEKVLSAATGPDEKVLNDTDQAHKLALGRFDRYKHLTRQEIYQKLGGYLGRRGFDWETSKKVIDDILKLEYN